MNQEILHRIQGKSLDVEELILTNDGQIDLLLRCSMEGLRLEISCRNVSDLNLSGIHYPMWTTQKMGGKTLLAIPCGIMRKIPSSSIASSSS